MPQVLLRDLDRHAADDRVAGVRVPHPVRAGLFEALRTLAIALPSQHAGAAGEERLDLVVERRRRDPFARVERQVAAERRGAFGGVTGLAQKERP